MFLLLLTINIKYNSSCHAFFQALGICVLDWSLSCGLEICGLFASCTYIV